MAAEADDLKRQVEQLESETARLAAQAENAAKKQVEMQSRREEKEHDVELVAQLRQKVVDLAEQIEKLKTSNRVIYNPAQGSSKAAWLVELTGQSIRVAAMGRPEKPVEFTGNRRQALAAFRKWAAGRNHRSEYFVLLIKSSGIDFFDQLNDELTQEGFDLGFDVVDDNLNTIDPETGAGI